MHTKTVLKKTESASRVSGACLMTIVPLIILSTIVLSCSHHPHVNLDGPYWKDDDTKAIAEPSFEETNIIWTSVKRTTFDQGLELMDFDRNVRKLFGNPVQAMNTNSFDEVPNSSWFTNRHGHPYTRLTPEQIAAGPGITSGPGTSEIWNVFRLKSGGATLGFWIEDSKGDQYIIKFDPAEFPEMATAAATMGSRFFHACGYNVPQEVIVYWDPKNLRIKPGATKKDGKGNKIPVTMDDINSILAQVYKEPDGKIRSLASLNVGNVKGPFMYEGTRKGDLNDWCPHQHRRDLRGLYVLGSLINHYDLKDHNSMDVYVGEDGSGYLKHYLMDFGSTFGSDGSDAKIQSKGYANTFDMRDVGASIFALGLKTWAWQDIGMSGYPSVGRFESEIFQPNKFDVIQPNTAFEQMTYQDAYWGAKIVMAFSDEDLAAIVETGLFSNPEAADYLLKTLKKRRDKIGRYWFGKVNPLDYPSIINATGGAHLSFIDLAVKYGLEPAAGAYRYEIRQNGNRIIDPTDTDLPAISLASPGLTQMRAGDDSDVSNLLEVRVKSKRGSGWTKDAIFWLHYDQSSKRFKVVGIEHPG